MNWCGQSWAKGLFISTFMPINRKKPNGKSYLGHRNSKQVGVWPLPRSGGHVCVFCALLKCIWSESQNKHGQGAIVFASAGTRASVVTYESESESRHQPGWGGSHKTLPVPRIRLLPPLPTPRSEPWGLKDEVMWLIPLYLLSRGSEQPLFGCLFFFFFKIPLREHTYAQCGSQSHPVCFLTTSCSQLWQTSNRRVDINFLVTQQHWSL